MLAYTLPPEVQDAGANLLQLAAYAAALAAISALWRKSPVRRVVAWLWRRNVSGPIGGWAERNIAATVHPIVQASRDAALAQHEEQNALMAAQSAAMAEGFTAVNHRLDRNAKTIERHTEQISELERDLRAPRTRRTRHDDDPTS